MVLQAMKAEGGVRYLRKQARNNAPAFLALVAKLLPKDLHVSGLENLTVNLMGPPAAQRPAIDVTPSASDAEASLPAPAQPARLE